MMDGEPCTGGWCRPGALVRDVKIEPPAFAGDLVVTCITISNLKRSAGTNREAAAGSKREICFLLRRAGCDLERFIGNKVDEELFFIPIEDRLCRHGVGPLFADVQLSSPIVGP